MKQRCEVCLLNVYAGVKCVETEFKMNTSNVQRESMHDAFS